MWWEPVSFFSSHVWISPTTCCWNSNCSRSDLLFFFFGCQCSSVKLASNSCLVDEMQMLQHLCLFWWYLYLKAVGYIKVWLSGQESNFLKNQVAVAGLGDVSVADSVAGRNDCVLTTHFSPRRRGKKVQTASYRILGWFSACLPTKRNVFFQELNVYQQISRLN